MFVKVNFSLDFDHLSNKGWSFFIYTMMKPLRQLCCPKVKCSIVQQQNEISKGVCTRLRKFYERSMKCKYFIFFEKHFL